MGPEENTHDEECDDDDRGAGAGLRPVRANHDPIGVPDSFARHVKLTFDLQVLAFASDITRVFAFTLSRDNSNRSYPESGFTSDSN